MLESGDAYAGCEPPVLVFIVGLILEVFLLLCFAGCGVLSFCILVPYVDKFGGLDNAVF